METNEERSKDVKKVKKIMAFLMTMLIVFTSAVDLPMFAKSNKVTLKVSVIGDGEVKVECDDFDYTVTENDGFIHDVQANTEFTFTITEKSQAFKRVTANQREVEVDKGSDIIIKRVINSNDDIVIEFEGNKNNAVTSSNEKDTKKDIQNNADNNVEVTDKPANDEALSNEKNEQEISNDISSKGKLKIDQEEVNENFVLSDEEQQIRDDYLKGNKMDQKYVDARKAVVQRINAYDYVDENYFIDDKYFEDYTTLTTLVYLQASILIDPEYRFSDETQIMPMSLNDPVVTSFYNTNIVTFADKIGNSVQMDGGYWKVDGHIAFCSNAKQSPPKNGAKLKASTLSNNENLRKALYYGYNGPDDRLSDDLSNDEAIIVTNELASNAKSNTSFCTMHGAGYVIKDIYSWIYALPTPPSNFKVYTADGIDYGTNSLGDTVVNQTMAYWILEEKGSLQIKKESANPEMTDGNNCYSLSGAEYGVYSDSTAKTKVATLTTTSNAWSNTVSLNAGTYYIKETKAPKGFELNTSIVKAVVEPNKTTKLSNGAFVDTPKNDPISIILKKVDADTGQSVPTGKGSLANAQFTLKFYKGDYTEGIDPSAQGKTPDKTWVLKTNEKGITRLNDSDKISGDSFYKIGNTIGLPLGTLTIQETKAPEGYHLNPAIFVRKLKEDGTGNVEAYNVPIIKENVLKLNITKAQENSNVMISGARFKHTRPNGATEELATDSNGNISMVGLENGVHTLKESWVKDGYDLNPTEIRFEVKSGGIITMLSNLSGTGISYNGDNNGNGSIKVEDKVSPYNLEIPKVNNHGKALDGAEFTLYADQACTKAISTKTTVDGKLMFTDIKDRTHYYFKETKAPKGYRIPVDTNGNVHVYDVYAESTPEKGIFDFYIDGTKYTVGNTNGDIHLSGSTADRIVSVKIVNAVGMKLPVTGSDLMIPIMLCGAGLMGTVIVLNRKKKGKK